MKTLIKMLLLACLILPCSLNEPLRADPPGDPPPLPGGHGSGTNQPPATAPIDGGIGILFLLGIAWAGMKSKSDRQDGA
ncbi:MAG TPA: hypothetical protein PKG48_12460 [Bacteroidales bacterium]|nr:hypothetical protein [Bacteroidales bacterium]